MTGVQDIAGPEKKLNPLEEMVPTGKKMNNYPEDGVQF